MSRYYPPVTVTGNPVNFSAPNGGKLDSVSVQIIPTQDLHGYDHPWPAGGGVNVADVHCDPFDSAGVTISAENNIVTINGTKSGDAYKTIPFNLPAGTYYVKAFVVGGTVSQSHPDLYIFDGTNNIAGTFYDSEKNFTIDTDSQLYIRLALWTDNVTYTNYKLGVVISKTAGISAFSPYSNICPISGRTGLDVYVSPTTAQADATTYAVDWTDEAGTVYGGTLNVVTGELVVDRGRVNVSSSWYWYKSGSYPGGFYATIENAGTGQKTNTPFICSHAKTTTSISQYVQGTCFCDGSINIRIMDGSDTVQDWKDYINAQITAGTPIQICYELATPITYQLTPKQIAALIDQNYIWSSNNETISVVYALLVPGSDKYTLIVNGVDIADFVERDSYRTTLYPVFSEAVQTLDGVGHTALLRKKGELSARFNPRTAADTAIICAALLNAPCEVQYHCLQRNADVTALMTIDSVSALYLSRCLYCRQKWNDIDSITLTEL